MSGKPFDASMKELVEQGPKEYATRFTKSQVQDAVLVDAEVSTVTAAADKVLKVTSAAGQSILDLEALSSWDDNAVPTLHLYSALLGLRHSLPVRSVLVVLHKRANSSKLTGKLELFDPEEAALALTQKRKARPYLVFRYQVVRVWKEKLQTFLQGPLSLLPLAALTDQAQGSLKGVVQQIIQRVRKETDSVNAGKLEATTFILLGLRYEAGLVDNLFKGVQEMEESSTYQLILSRGAIRALREAVLRQGTAKFKKEPDEDAKQEIDSITDLDRLNDLLDKVHRVNSWKKLLADS